ncbi:uncharacterized protein [Rutidosis leptorrhynchoides]|uniref:uncharacterized protein n=1 Tax=Rutidosis leptorrhynchoides TaxID=125765 RepID=UPI003A99CC12
MMSLFIYDEEGICNISKCANLKNLTLRKCKMERSLGVTVGVNIHLPELSNLTLEYGEYSYGSSLTKGLNVFAPKLVSLVFKGPYSVLLQFSSFSLCVLEKVDLCIYKRFYKADKTKYDKFVALLHQLHNAKYIKLNLDVTQLIFNLGEIILHQPSPFAKLKHLKVYPHDPFSTEQQTMPTKVKNYFLDSSPDATFTMVSYEEMKAVEYATSAQKDMAELQMLLEEGKIHHERETKIHEKQLDTKEIQITNCLKDMSVQIEQGKVKICGIISKLGQIENWLKKLPKTDRIHSCFSSLRAEVYTVIKLIMDCTKIKCDEKQGCINVCLHELATASQPSS